MGAEEFRVDRAREDAHGLVVALEGLSDRTTAQRWAGSAVFVARGALSSEADTYFDFELVGLVMVNRAGEVLGTIAEVLETGANDVLVVESPHGELLVPGVPIAVLRIDTAAGRVVVDERMVVRDDDAGTR